MMLPAPQWFAWIYAVLFWIFALGFVVGAVALFALALFAALRNI